MTISIDLSNSLADECRSRDGAARIPNNDGEAVAAVERLKLLGNISKRQRSLDLRGPPAAQIQTFFVYDARFPTPDVKVELRR